MITAVVTFKLPPEMSREKWQENIKTGLCPLSECSRPAKGHVCFTLESGHRQWRIGKFCE